MHATGFVYCENITSHTFIGYKLMENWFCITEVLMPRCSQVRNYPYEEETLFIQLELIVHDVTFKYVKLLSLVALFACISCWFVWSVTKKIEHTCIYNM